MIGLGLFATSGLLRMCQRAGEQLKVNNRDSETVAETAKERERVWQGKRDGMGEWKVPEKVG